MKIIESPFNNYPYLIYKIVNLVNGKIYIGRTTIFLSGRTLAHLNRLKGGRYSHLRLYKAFKKYKFENFSIEHIYHAETFEELKRVEKELILKYNSMNKDIGYNMSLDTEDGMEVLSPESIIKRRDNHLKSMFTRMKKSKTGYYVVSKATQSTYRAQIRDIDFCHTDIKIVAYIADLLIIHFHGQTTKLNFPENLEFYKTKNVFEEMEKIKTEISNNFKYNIKKQLQKDRLDKLERETADIVHLYINEELTSTEIAKIYKTNHKTILDRLKRANCPRRNSGTVPKRKKCKTA